MGRTDDAPTIRKQSRRALKRRDVSISGQFKPRFWKDSDNRIGVLKPIKEALRIFEIPCWR